MSIAYDVHKEMAQRIVNEARSSDKITIEIYSEHHDERDNCTKFIPFLVASRYQSSPKDSIYVQSAYMGKLQHPIRINSKDALRSILVPPAAHYADLTLLYVLQTGENPVARSISWCNGKTLDSVVAEAFSKCVLHNYVCTEDEGGIDNFLGGDDFVSFVWNLLN